MAGTEHVNVYAYDGESWRERWTFAHVSANGARQASRKRYLTKWNAKRAAKKLYPNLEIRYGQYGNS